MKYIDYRYYIFIFIKTNIWTFRNITNFYWEMPKCEFLLSIWCKRRNWIWASRLHWDCCLNSEQTEIYLKKKITFYRTKKTWKSKVLQHISIIWAWQLAPTRFNANSCSKKKHFWTVHIFIFWKIKPNPEFWLLKFCINNPK